MIWSSVSFIGEGESARDFRFLVEEESEGDEDLFRFRSFLSTLFSLETVNLKTLQLDGYQYLCILTSHNQPLSGDFCKDRCSS